MSDALFGRVLNYCMTVGLVAITGGVVGIMAALVVIAWRHA